MKVYNNWGALEGMQQKVTAQKKITIPESGEACDHYNRYKSDIALMKNLGFNSYRFSISWGKVMPECKIDKSNEDVLQHYENVCQELVENGIQPIITLYYYTHPVWFEKMGAFEKEENVRYFKEYCEMIFRRLNKYKPIFFTINTFAGGAFAGYYQAIRPPFKKDLKLAVKVLKNLLEAHVRVYRALKKIDPDATIGIYKEILPLEEKSSTFTGSALSMFGGFIGSSPIEAAKKLKDSSIYEFFTKGILKIDVGLSSLGIGAKVNHENEEAIGAFDCIGLNYYSGSYLDNITSVARKDCISTEHDLYTIYPEGFEKALLQVSENLVEPLKKLKKNKRKEMPIYITENGIATSDEQDREYYFKSHLSVLSKALEKGLDIRGYIAWSLFDSYDWLGGYGLHYGLFAVNRDTQKRTLKEGACFFCDVVKNMESKNSK